MLFPPERIVKINAILVTSGHIAWMIGPFFAGVLLSVLSIKYLFLVDAASFLLGFVLLLFITQPIHFSQLEDHSHWSELKQDLSYLFSQKPIFWIIIITFINNLFIMGPAIVGLPVLVKIVLNGTASDFALFGQFCRVGNGYDFFPRDRHSSNHGQQNIHYSIAHSK